MPFRGYPHKEREEREGAKRREGERVGRLVREGGQAMREVKTVSLLTTTISIHGTSMQQAPLESISKVSLPFSLASRFSRGKDEGGEKGERHQREGNEQCLAAK